jgi:hypothetical protein
MSALPATVPQRVRLFRNARAKALASALEGQVSLHNPASFLQKHPDVTIVCDRAAADDQRNNIPTIEKPHA